jgi:hypothetical protein
VIDRSRLPERHQRILLIGGLGSLIGVATGAAVWRTYWAIAIGSFLGAVVGYVVAQFLPHSVRLERLKAADRRLDVLLSVVSGLFGVFGLIGFLATGRADVGLSAAFFVICAVCLFAFAKER